MRFRYDFYVPSEILTTEGAWDALTVSRGATTFRIMKPERPVDPPLHAVLSLPSDTDMVRFGLSQLHQVASFIPMEGDRPGPPAMEDIREWPEVLLLEDLLQWIRVLTHQFWVGIKSRGWVERRVAVREVIGNGLKRVMQPGYSWGFGCERLLDEAAWREIEQKLSCGTKPRPSQVFLCDALNEVSEWDVPQAILALGVCCEVEVQSLIQEIVATKAESLQRVFADHVRFTFAEAIGKIIENLGGEPFRCCEPDATKLVLSLYEMRGKVAHRGVCMRQDSGKHVEVGFKDLASHVQAVDKLFAWSERQRTHLLGRGPGR